MTTGTLRLKCSSGGKVLADVSSCTCAPPNTGTPPQCVPPTPFRTRIATCYAYPQVEAPLNSYQYYRMLTVMFRRRCVPPCRKGIAKYKAPAATAAQRLPKDTVVTAQYSITADGKETRTQSCATLGPRLGRATQLRGCFFLF